MFNIYHLWIEVLYFSIQFYEYNLSKQKTSLKLPFNGIFTHIGAKRCQDCLMNTSKQQLKLHLCSSKIPYRLMPAANWSTPQNILESIASQGECCLTSTRTVECAALWPENRFEIRAGWEKSARELADLTSRVEVEVGPGFWNETEQRTRRVTRTKNKHQASCRRQCVIAKCLVILAKNWLWNPLYIGLAVTAFTTFDRRLSGEICVVVAVVLWLFVATSTRSHYFDLFSLLIALTMFLQ